MARMTATYFEESQYLDATRGEIWALLTDIPHWPYWQRRVVDARQVFGHGFHVGAVYRLRGTRCRMLLSVVTECLPYTRFVLSAHLLGLDVESIRTIQELPAGGCVVTIQFACHGPTAKLIAGTRRSIIDQYVAEQLDGLRNVLQRGRWRPKATGPPIAGPALHSSKLVAKSAALPSVSRGSLPPAHTSVLH